MAYTLAFALTGLRHPLAGSLSMDLQQARSNMIEQQVRPWDVLDQDVLNVLAEVPREQFVDPTRSGIAYSDFPQPIGHGQFMLKPTLDGRLLQALRLDLTSDVLEIGTGSGYLTACLARLAGHVESLELIPELASNAEQRLATLGVTNVRIRQQDAAAEWDARDGYDAIAFSGSLIEVPDFYKQRLRINGRLFAIVGEASKPAHEAIVITRISDTLWNTESLFETRVEPLANFTREKPTFTF